MLTRDLFHILVSLYQPLFGELYKTQSVYLNTRLVKDHWIDQLFYISRAESGRLLAAMLKNCRSKETMRSIVASGGLPPVTQMLHSTHVRLEFHFRKYSSHVRLEFHFRKYSSSLDSI